MSAPHTSSDNRKARPPSLRGTHRRRNGDWAPALVLRTAMRASIFSVPSAAPPPQHTRRHASSAEKSGIMGAQGGPSRPPLHAEPDCGAHRFCHVPVASERRTVAPSKFGPRSSVLYISRPSWASGALPVQSSSRLRFLKHLHCQLATKERILSRCMQPSGRPTNRPLRQRRHGMIPERSPSHLDSAQRTRPSSPNRRNLAPCSWSPSGGSKASHAPHTVPTRLPAADTLHPWCFGSGNAPL